MRFAGLVFVLGVACIAQVASATDVMLPFGGRHYFKDEKESCQAETLCPALHRAIDRCKPVGNQKACADFLDTVRELLPKHDCKRSFDKDPVPGLWLCKRPNTIMSDDTTYEVFYLLRGLTYPEARALYNSKEFEAVTDGELSEEYHDTKGAK